MTSPQLHEATRSEAEAREDFARKDRQGWYAPQRTSFVISRKCGAVCRCETKEIRDTILLMALSWDAMKAALEECADELEAEIRARAAGELPRRIAIDLKTVERARDALKLADGK